MAIELDGTETPYFLKVCSAVVPFAGHQGSGSDKVGL